LRHLRPTSARRSSVAPPVQRTMTGEDALPRLRPSPALVVACIALAVSLGGTSYAAITLPKNSVGTKQLKKNAVISTKVKNGSLLRADFKSGQIPAGPQGPQGPQGPPGSQGNQGIQGPPGPITGEAPPGVTLRGNYALSQTGSQAPAFGAVSFPLRLSVAPTVHYIPVGEPPPAACPGNGTTPQANPGHLCVYETNVNNVSARLLFNPETFQLGASREGVGIQINPSSTDQAVVWGSWAVTV
jgi:hypothetical protein